MTAVLFCMAMIIEIVYVIMSPVPKELENKYLLIGTAFICAADFTYHTEYITIKMYVLALLGSVATLILRCWSNNKMHRFCRLIFFVVYGTFSASVDNTFN